MPNSCWTSPNVTNSEGAVSEELGLERGVPDSSPCLMRNPFKYFKTLSDVIRLAVMTMSASRCRFVTWRTHTMSPVSPSRLRRFAASRARKVSSNGADQLRKYHERFGLGWNPSVRMRRSGDEPAIQLARRWSRDTSAPV